MRILIIGGTGLISAPMTRMLLARGDDVTHYNRGRLDLYPAPAAVQTVHGDRTDYPTFERQMQELGAFDCIVDMVGYLPEDAPQRRACLAQAHRPVPSFAARSMFTSKPASHYPVTESEAYGGLNTYSRNKVAIEQTSLPPMPKATFP